MRKSVLVTGAFVVAILASSQANAWTQPREGFGLGIGSGTGATGVSAKWMIQPGALQFVLGFWGHGDGNSGPGPRQYRPMLIKIKDTPMAEISGARRGALRNRR